MNTSKKLVPLLLAAAMLCSTACAFVPTVRADTVDLWVYAVDQNGGYYAVPVYIDDVYVGDSGNAYPVTPGYHEIYVEPDTWGLGILLFQFYSYDAPADGLNPLTIYVTSETGVYAHYRNMFG